MLFEKTLFVEVEGQNGEKLLVNPTHIVAMGPVMADGIPRVGETGIMLSNGNMLIVKGSANDLSLAIAARGNV